MALTDAQKEEFKDYLDTLSHDKIKKTAGGLQGLLLLVFTPEVITEFNNHQMSVLQEILETRLAIENQKIQKNQSKIRQYQIVIDTYIKEMEALLKNEVFPQEKTFFKTEIKNLQKLKKNLSNPNFTMTQQILNNDIMFRDMTLKHIIADIRKSVFDNAVEKPEYQLESVKTSIQNKLEAIENKVSQNFMLGNSDDAPPASKTAVNPILVSLSRAKAASKSRLSPHKALEESTKKDFKTIISFLLNDIKTIQNLSNEEKEEFKKLEKSLQKLEKNLNTKEILENMSIENKNEIDGEQVAEYDSRENAYVNTILNKAVESATGINLDAIMEKVQVLQTNVIIKTQEKFNPHYTSIQKLDKFIANLTKDLAKKPQTDPLKPKEDDRNAKLAVAREARRLLTTDKELTLGAIKELISSNKHHTKTKTFIGKEKLDSILQDILKDIEPKKKFKP